MCVCVCVCVQVYRCDAADTVRQAQELATYLPVRDAGADVGHVGGRVAADSRRHELHRPPSADARRLHVLQRRIPHLLVDDVVLHSVRRHRAAVLANIPPYSQSTRR